MNSIEVVEGSMVYAFNNEQLVNVFDLSEYFHGLTPPDLIDICQVKDVYKVIEDCELDIEECAFEPIDKYGSHISLKEAYFRGLKISSKQQNAIDIQISLLNDMKHIYQNGFMFRNNNGYREAFMRKLRKVRKGIIIETDCDSSVHPQIMWNCIGWKIELTHIASIQSDVGFSEVKVWNFESKSNEC